MTLMFIKRIIKAAPKPVHKDAMDNQMFTKMVDFLRGGGGAPPYTSESDRPCHSRMATAAALCYLRGTGGRPGKIPLLRHHYFVPNYENGKRDGFDVFFPEVNEHGKPITLKGHDDADARHKTIPEVLDDDYPLSQIIANFLTFAPKRGPLF